MKTDFIKRIQFVSIFLVFTGLASAVDGQNAKNSSFEACEAIASLLDLSELAAMEQYAGLVQREHFASDVACLGGVHFRRVRHCYIAELALIDKIINDGGRISSTDKRVISRVYNQIAWFAMLTRSESLLGVDSEKLINKSIEFDEHNAVALYMQGMIAVVRNRAGARQFFTENCRRALAIDTAFPEAWLEIRLNAIREGSSSRDNADNAMEQFISHLKDFKPELYYFDAGYPAEINVIAMPPAGEPLKRQLYKPGLERFKNGGIEFEKDKVSATQKPAAPA